MKLKRQMGLINIFVSKLFMVQCNLLNKQGGFSMAILTSIKDAFNGNQYKFEIERLMEENKRLKHIKLNPTQMALSQVLAKTEELEVELEGYDRLIETK